MNGRDIVRCAIFTLAVVIVPMQLWSAIGCAAEAAAKSEELEVTPSLVREIQFMLLRLGMEPGPIDGVIGPQTTRAWHKFQQDTGLPPVDLVNGSKILATALTRLRSEASRVIFEGERKPGLPPAAPTPPAAAVAPVQPPAPASDRFAACPYHAEDFRIGTTQYTPEKYLQEGFDGSTARAVSMLKDRLNEARQIAGNIGGSALTEVQRQSRVLDYFTCRLKIEQESQK
jgi:peptidoglycan hydrolase-like protein with peptidoglycan-binding domain